MKKDLDHLDRLWDRAARFFPHPKAGHQSRLYRRYLCAARRFERRWGVEPASINR